MKKTTLLAAAIAALAITGCNDNSASDDNDGRANDFVNGFNKKSDYTLNIKPNPASGGNVSRNPNNQTYKDGDTVIITAAPKQDYIFTSWSGALNDTVETLTLVMNRDMELEANFISTSVESYPLNITLAPNEGGHVSRGPNQIVYKKGDTVTVTAAAKNGYMFTGWSGALNDTTAAATVKIERELSLTANFMKTSETHYTITVAIEPNNGGGVSLYPLRTAYKPGDTVAVKATAADGYTFTEWTGALTSNNDSGIIVMDGDKRLTARFAYKGEDDGSKLSIKGEQVYELESTIFIFGQNFDLNLYLKNRPPSYTDVTLEGFGSRTVSGSRNFADYFTNPVVKVTNGKLTVELGKPTSALVSVTDWGIEISDRSANIFNIAGFRVSGNNDGVFGINVGTSGKTTDTNIDNIEFYYADKDVTIASQKEFALHLRKGWNTVTMKRVDSTTSSPINILDTYEDDDIRWFTNIVTDSVTPPSNNYKITFDATGGTVNPTSDMTGTDGKLASLPTPTKSGYTFDGWYTAETGGTAVTESKVYTANTTIYARWTAEPVTPPGGSIVYGTSVTYGGETYQTVVIGSQTWFARNLNYDVPGVTTDVCYENKEENCAKYGRLYNWNAAITACPAGWHLPSDAEWTQLSNYVESQSGCSGCAGTKLKSTSGWNDYQGKSGNGTDEYGFSALPGGGTDIGSDGLVAYGAGDVGIWWSATDWLGAAESDPSNPWHRVIGISVVERYAGSKIYPFSVRCVAD